MASTIPIPKGPLTAIIPTAMDTCGASAPFCLRESCREDYGEKMFIAQKSLGRGLLEKYKDRIFYVNGSASL